MIANVQTSSFNHQRHHTVRAKATSQPTKNSKPIAANRQLIPTQPTEYKRFTNHITHSSNPFLAQYIDQSRQTRSRGFIGRKPAWQAQKSYQESQDILRFTDVSHFDKSI